MTCVVTEDKTGSKCWGQAQHGELGAGNTLSMGDDEELSSVPSLTIGSDELDQLFVGDYHSCAIFTNGESKCWGWNHFGQLGSGDLESKGDDESIASLSYLNFGSGVKATSFYLGVYHRYFS